MWASITGHLTTAKLLIENGADPNVKAEYEITALILASQNLFLEIAKLRESNTRIAIGHFVHQQEITCFKSMVISIVVFKYNCVVFKL